VPVVVDCGLCVNRRVCPEEELYPVDCDKYEHRVKRWDFENATWRLQVYGDPRPFGFELIRKGRHRRGLPQGSVYELWRVLQYHGTWGIYRRAVGFLEGLGFEL